MLNVFWPGSQAGRTLLLPRSSYLRACVLAIRPLRAPCVLKAENPNRKQGSLALSGNPQLLVFRTVRSTFDVDIYLLFCINSIWDLKSIYSCCPQIGGLYFFVEAMRSMHLGIQPDGGAPDAFLESMLREKRHQHNICPCP